jgi:hypothetical protein
MDSGEVLDALAQTNERLIEFYEKLKEHRAVKAVTHDFDLRHYEDQASFLGELFVDAELVTGRVACWSVSFSLPSERWLIVSEVRTSAPGGQQVLKSFPDRTARTGKEFAEAIGSAVSELVNSLDSIDLMDV